MMIGLYPPSNPVIYSGSIDTLGGSGSLQEKMVNNLKLAYQGTSLQIDPNMQEFINVNSQIEKTKVTVNYINNHIAGLRLSPAGTAVLTQLDAGSVWKDCTSTIYNGYTIPGLTHEQTVLTNKTLIVTNGTGTGIQQVTCNDGTYEYATEIKNITCNGGYVEGAGSTCILDVCGLTIDVNGSSTATSQIVSQNWHYSATAGVCTFGCNIGYNWNGTTCVPNNCIAGNQTVNTHTYSVSGFNHTTTTTTTTNVAITNGTRTYSQQFICNYGNITTNGTETNPSNTCNLNYTWNGSSCVVNTQVVSCGGSIIANATSNASATTWTQTWNGTSWLPYYARTRSATAGLCTYNCNVNYTWNGSSCVVSTQTYTCTGLPSNAVWNTVGSYTQTWNGSAWIPANSTSTYNLTSSTTTCNFICNTDYIWNGTACENTCTIDATLDCALY